MQSTLFTFGDHAMRKAIIAAVLIAFLPQLAFAQASDREMRNQEAVRQYKAHINLGDAKAAAADWVEDAQTFGRPTMRTGVQRVLEDIFVTFPDWHMEIQSIVADGDTVVVHSKVSGTHRGVGKLAVNGGMLVGVQPTGKHFEVSAVHWYKLRDGKLAEGFGVRDDLGMMQQLGLLPSAVAGAK
jgi:predicted ester cyclase